MKIVVKGGFERDIRILLPSGMIWNGMTALTAAGFLKKKGIVVSAAQLQRLFREIRRYKRSYPEWTLVDVQRAGGEHITVKL